MSSLSAQTQANESTSFREGKSTAYRLPDKSGFLVSSTSVRRGKGCIEQTFDKGFVTRTRSKRLRYFDEEIIAYQVNSTLHISSSSACIGHASGHVFELSRSPCSTESFYATCDSHSQSFGDMAAEFLNHEVDVCDFVGYSDLFFAEVLEILPKYRGAGLGAKFFRQVHLALAQLFDLSTTIFVPFPLQFRNEHFYTAEATNAERRAFRASTKALSSYYQRSLGARVIWRKCDWLMIKAHQTHS